MVEIKGQKISGFGKATKALKLQRKKIKATFEEIECCHNGTINICLEKNVIVLNPDYRTEKIKWSDSMPEEIFDFLRVQLVIPRLGKKYRAWLYIPHNSRHRKYLNIHEIICKKIKKINECEKLIIRIEKDFIQLPYRLGAIYIFL